MSEKKMLKNITDRISFVWNNKFNHIKLKRQKEIDRNQFYIKLKRIEKSNKMVLLHETIDILTNDGYKSIVDLKSGDTVLDMHLNPVVVSNVEKYECETELHELRCENWYIPLYMNGDHKVMIGDDKLDDQVMNEGEKGLKYQVVEFKEGKDIEVGTKLASLSFFERIGVEPNEDIEISFNMGHLIGLYLGFGNIRDNVVEFKFGPTEQVINEMKELLEKLYPEVEMKVEKSEYIYRIQITNEKVTELLNEFGTGMEKRVPLKYMVAEDEYCYGVIKGLSEGQDNFIRSFPVSRDIARLYIYCCRVLGLQVTNNSQYLTGLPNKYVLFVYKNNQSDAYQGKVVAHNKLNQMKHRMYDVEFETENVTIFANNVVIKF
jgi:hypothetical protein